MDLPSSGTNPTEAALVHTLLPTDLPSPTDEARTAEQTRGKCGFSELDDDVVFELLDELPTDVLTGLLCLPVACDATAKSSLPPATADAAPAEPVAPIGDVSPCPATREATPGEESAKQESQRAKWKRKYQRKKAKMAELRAEVKALEAEMSALTTTHPTTVTCNHNGHNMSEAPVIRTKLESLLRLKTVLRSENVQLRKLFRESNAHVTTVRDLLDIEHSLYLANSSYFVVLKPLTLPGCKAIIQRGLQKIYAFSANAACPASLGALCGWDKKQLICPAGFQASMKKTFVNQSARAVLERTWQLVTTPRTWEKLHSPAFNTHIRLVQRVDDDHMVFLRDCAVKDGDGDWILESTMTLLSKTKTSNGYMVQLTGIDRELLPVEDRLEQRAVPSQVAGKVVEVWSTDVYW